MTKTRQEPHAQLRRMGHPDADTHSVVRTRGAGAPSAFVSRAGYCAPLLTVPLAETIGNETLSSMRTRNCVCAGNSTSLPLL